MSERESSSKIAVLGATLAPMLHLASRTDPAWGTWAVTQLDAILLDHAHCEKKAASTALGLVYRYPERPELVVPLARLAREELAHFEQVVVHVRRRGGEFQRTRPSPYAERLLTVVRHGEPHRFIDTMLCCAMIEARSCERMQLVAEALEGARARGESIDEAVLELYRGLLASEARHHRAYVELVELTGVVGVAELRARLHEVAEHEARIIADAPCSARLHDASPRG